MVLLPSPLVKTISRSSIPYFSSHAIVCFKSSMFCLFGCFWPYSILRWYKHTAVQYTPLVRYVCVILYALLLFLSQNEFKTELPCISNCMVIGDKRKFLTILIALRVEVIIQSNQHRSLPTYSKFESWLKEIYMDAPYMYGNCCTRQTLYFAIFSRFI